MNKIILALLMMLVLTQMVVIVAAAPVVSYAQVTTGFTVTITANALGKPETAMNFTGKIGSAKIFPNGTNNGKNRWGYIYNTGRTYLSFQMASRTPGNIILKVDAHSDMKHAFNVTNTPGHPSGTNWNGWRSVPYHGVANIFAVTYFNVNATKKFNVPVNVTAQR